MYLHGCAILEDHCNLLLAHTFLDDDGVVHEAGASLDPLLAPQAGLKTNHLHEGAAIARRNTCRY